MTQLSDDCFAFGGELMSVPEALNVLRARTVALPGVERVSLGEALGRVLAAPLRAERNVPPYDSSAVDGYAVFFQDLKAAADTQLTLGGRATAGHPLGRPARRGEAIRIFTGAPVPEGPDTVLMQEDCEEASGAVTIPPGIRQGANLRKAGEDISAGDEVLVAGARLRAQEIGIAASLGLTELEVYRPLRVALLSTGDEVGEPGADLAQGMLYDSNRYVLRALLTGLGCQVTDLGVLPDRMEVIRDALGKAAADHDVIVTSGGMSTGDEDHVKSAVEAQGSIHFWRLAIKPGRPVALGQIGRVPFLGLPGNPVAVMVTFLTLARPLLLRLSGALDKEPLSFLVPMGFPHEKRAGRREYLRARLTRGDKGRALERLARDGAGVLTSMAEADGLAVVTEEVTALQPGDLVEFIPFTELIG